MAGSEQAEDAPVAQAEGEYAVRGNEAVDAPAQDVEDVGFVVVGVEILAQRSMPERHARVGDADDIGAARQQYLGVRVRRPQGAQLPQAPGEHILERLHARAGNPARSIDVDDRQFDLISRKGSGEREYHLA